MFMKVLTNLFSNYLQVRSRLGLLVACLFIYIINFNVVYAAGLSVSLDDKQIPIKVLFRDRNNNLYMKVSDYCKTLGFHYRVDRKTNILSIKKEQKVLCIDIRRGKKGATDIVLNDKRLNIKPSILVYNDFILIPLKPVSSLLNIKMSIKKVPRKKSQKKVPYSKPKARPRKAKVKTENESTYSQKSFPTLALKTGFFHFKPEIEDLNYDKKSRLAHNIRLGINKNFAVELQYNSYKDQLTGTLQNQPATVSVETHNFTGFVIYTLPYKKWNYSIGLGYGEQKFDLHFYSQALGGSYNRWFRLGVAEWKLGLEYMITENHSLELVGRFIYSTDEDVVLRALNDSIQVGYDDVYFGLNHILYFN